MMYAAPSAPTKPPKRAFGRAVNCVRSAWGVEFIDKLEERLTRYIWNFSVFFYGIIPSNPLACWGGVRQKRSHGKIAFSGKCDVMRAKNRCGRSAKAGKLRRMKHWEIIADNLSKAGWSWGCVSALDSEGRTIFVAALPIN